MPLKKQIKRKVKSKIVPPSKKPVTVTHRDDRYPPATLTKPAHTPPPTQHDVVNKFLRIWAGFHFLDVGTDKDPSCDLLMARIIDSAMKTQPRKFQHLCCNECKTPAPFLTLLGIEPGMPILCLKCQAKRDLTARVQERVLEHLDIMERKSIAAQ